MIFKEQPLRIDGLEERAEYWPDMVTSEINERDFGNVGKWPSAYCDFVYLFVIIWAYYNTNIVFLFFFSVCVCACVYFQVVFGSIVLLMLWLPIRIIKLFFPTFLPYNVMLYRYTRQHQIIKEFSAELKMTSSVLCSGIMTIGSCQRKCAAICSYMYIVN